MEKEEGHADKWLDQGNAVCSTETIDLHSRRDKESSKTWTRKFVERFLMNRSWYFPRKDKNNGPDLSKAYAYYEHFTLSRYLTNSDDDVHNTIRADPWEARKTELYNPFGTSTSNLGEFGIGVGLYFTMLRILAIILIIAGLINLPNIIYYSSADYKGENNNNFNWTTSGNAICTQKEWLACSNCDEENGRINATTPEGWTKGWEIIVERNACPRPELALGMANYASLIFLVMCFFLLGRYEKQREITLDEDKQTAQDYSVVVKNPPPEAYDPEIWREYFSQFAEKQVTSISVILNNHQLVRKLTQRRVWRKNLERYLPEKLDLDDENLVRNHVSMLMEEREEERKNICSLLCGCTLFPILRSLGYFLPPDILVDKIFSAKEEIEELLEEKYDVIKVFATFETEEAQRKALDALKTSKRIVKRNQTEKLPSEKILEGRVLRVVEAPEPDTVRWLDLHVGVITRYVQRIITFFLTIGIILAAAQLVNIVREKAGSRYSAYLTVFFNFIIPLIVKLFILIEKHSDESSRQESLYTKITLFRWVNTALLTMFQTPFTSTLADGNIDIIVTIQNILIAELWLSPVLRLLDLNGNLGKHFFAPREPTQERMNLWFQGTYYNLGERYTDFTKILFVVFVYSAIFPTGFFYGAAILIVQYYVDMYCIMRIWKRAPFLGSELASFSRRYFFPLALLAFGMSASYIYAQFPFSEFCDPLEKDQYATRGNYSYTTKGETQNIFVEKNTNVVLCNQGNWIFDKGFLGFPAVPSVLQPDDETWMTNGQETLTNVYGWSTVALLVSVFVIIFGQSILAAFQVYFKGAYKPEGKDAKIDFQNVPNISIYVPQVFFDGLEFPVLACEVSNINKDWIDWNDPNDPSYDMHNMINDFSHRRIEQQRYQNPSDFVKSKDSEVSSYKGKSFPVFSIVKSWSCDQGNYE